MRYTPKQLATALVETVEKDKTSAQKAAEEVIAILASQQELSRVRDVMQMVEQVWKQRYGAATITIDSAHPLNAHARKKIESLSHGAEIKEEIDATLIGGARVRIDDRIIDASISGQLNQLKSLLVK